MAKHKYIETPEMTEEIFEDICLEIEETWEGLLALCKKRGFKSRHHFNRFKEASEERLNRYARARENQLDYFEELLREVSFSDSKDNEVIDKVNVGSNAVSRDRLKADTIKFILGKLRSNTWGNSLKLEVNQEPRVFNITL